MLAGVFRRATLLFVIFSDRAILAGGFCRTPRLVVVFSGGAFRAVGVVRRVLDEFVLECSWQAFRARGLDADHLEVGAGVVAAEHFGAGRPLKSGGIELNLPFLGLLPVEAAEVLGELSRKRKHCGCEKVCLGVMNILGIQEKNGKS